MLKEIDLSRADLNLLVLFEAVMRERHVGRAAGHLHLSASAVSHGLGRLRRLLNDPVFLRTPKGVVPTARAIELAGPIGIVLSEIRNVIATAAPFNPATSTRHFTIGAPDGVLAVFLPSLLAKLRQSAPRIDIRLRQLLPPQGGRPSELAWEPVFADLESGAMDLAIGPFNAIPARFDAKTLQEDDFVIVARSGHPFARTPSLERYCAAGHMVVSLTGDAHGFVDDALAHLGLVRRVALTVPSFFMTTALVATTDLLAAVPRSFAPAFVPPSGVVVREAPLALPRFQIRAVIPKAALADAGVVWLRESLGSASS
jgi:DNA-binding transcriptional LysR family regulator